MGEILSVSVIARMSKLPCLHTARLEDSWRARKYSGTQRASWTAEVAQAAGGCNHLKVVLLCNACRRILE